MKTKKQLLKEGYKPFLGGYIKVPKDWLKNVKVSGTDGGDGTMGVAVYSACPICKFKHVIGEKCVG